MDRERWDLACSETGTAVGDCLTPPFQTFPLCGWGNLVCEIGGWSKACVRNCECPRSPRICFLSQWHGSCSSSAPVLLNACQLLASSLVVRNLRWYHDLCQIPGFAQITTIDRELWVLGCEMHVCCILALYLLQTSQS